MQKPIQKLKSVKVPGNTFNLNPKWARTLPSLIYCSRNIYRDHPFTTKKKSFIKVDISYHAEDLRCRNQSRHLSQLKSRAIPLTMGKKYAVLNIFSWDINIDHPSHEKYQISKLIFDTLLWACGAETHPVKGLGNTFDLSSKWERTLPSLIYCSWDIYRNPSFTKKNQISQLIFDTLLWV